MNDVGQLALIALGSNETSNWGDARETVLKAMIFLAESASTPVRQSGLYKTPAYPAGAGPDFVNAAAVFYTTLSAPDLLQVLHAIEAKAQRKRVTRWSSRTLDLDLIALSDTVYPDAATQTHWRDLPPDRQAQDAPDALILPHPRVQDRSFVLVPLADIAPNWHHPLLNVTVAQMLERLPLADRAAAVPLD